MNDKILIVYRVVVQYEKHHDVAKEFRTTIPAISTIVKKAKKSKEFLDEMMAKRDLI